MNVFIKTTVATLILSLGLIISTTAIVSAEGAETLPQTTNTTQTQQTPQKDLATYIHDSYLFIIGFASVLAVVMIIYGGVTYMTTDAVYGKKEGIRIIKNALIGLLLVLGSYLILYTINPELVKLDTVLPKIQINPQQGATSKTP